MKTGKGRCDKGPTLPVTGFDASADEADIGSAGNGVDPFDGDLQGGREDMEDEPSGRDIDTDQIKKMAGEPDEDDLEISAKPTEKQEIDLSSLP